MAESRLKLFSAPLKDIVPPRQKLIRIDAGESVGKTLERLVNANIYSAPVYSPEKKEYVGFIDVLDVVINITKIVDETVLLGEDFNLFTADLDERNEKKFSEQRVGRIADLSKQNPMHGFGPHTPIIEALRQLRTVHRIFVTKDEGVKKVENLLTQSAVVAWLETHLDALGEDILNKTISELGFVNSDKQILSVNEGDIALKAFQIMAQHKISAVPILHEKDGTLVSCITSKDLRAIIRSNPKDKDRLTFAPLYVPSREFMALDQIAHASKDKKDFQTCKPTDTLREVIQRLARLKIHRVFVLNDAGQPQGVVSLGDVLRVLTADIAFCQTDKEVRSGCLCESCQANKPADEKSQPGSSSDKKKSKTKSSSKKDKKEKDGSPSKGEGHSAEVKSTDDKAVSSDAPQEKDKKKSSTSTKEKDGKEAKSSDKAEEGAQNKDKNQDNKKSNEAATSPSQKKKSMFSLFSFGKKDEKKTTKSEGSDKSEAAPSNNDNNSNKNLLGEAQQRVQQLIDENNQELETYHNKHANQSQGEDVDSLKKRLEALENEINFIREQNSKLVQSVRQEYEQTIKKMN